MLFYIFGKFLIFLIIILLVKYNLSWRIHINKYINFKIKIAI